MCALRKSEKSKFDSKIASKMKNYRYRKSDTISEIDEKNEPSSFENIDVRRTRSGQIFSLSVNMLNAKYLNEVESCSLSKLSINSNGAEKVKLKSCLKRKYGIQKIGVPNYNFSDLKGMSAITVEKVSQFKEPVKHSTFQNGQNCSVKLFLKPDVTHRKVKFSHAIVYFC